MNSKHLFAKLLELRNEAGENIHTRLSLAQQLLADRDWVTCPEGGGGDESHALDRLEEECFADVCGAISLVEMLELLRVIPDVKVWKRNKFNLRKMCEELRERKQAEKRVNGERPRVTGEGESLVDTIKRLRDEIRSLKSENKELRKDNVKLRRALTALAGGKKSNVA